MLKILRRVIKSAGPLLSKTDVRDYPAFAKLAVAIAVYRLRSLIYGKRPQIGALSDKTTPIRIDGVWFGVPPYPGDFGFIYECLLERTYERDARFVPHENWTCLDIGANIGACSARWRKNNVNGTIYCFEPHPLAFERLAENARRNGWKNTICLNAALSSRSGELRLNLQRTQARVEADEYTSTEVVVVKTYSLADFFAEKELGRVELCKIDVEGHEVAVLNGGMPVLPKIQRIVLEYHSPELKAQVKELLQHDFDLVLEDSTHDGLMYFVRRSSP